MIPVLLFAGVCFLAYSNGANDNFKGVATLFGSKTTNYNTAIWWATITTFSGSLASIVMAESLVKSFSGKGLVPDSIISSSGFIISVVLAAAITVIFATLLGFPVSTTHGLTGALVGSGFMAVGTQVNLAVLGKAFFLPLLLSPVIAIILSFFIYIIFRFTRLKTGVTKEVCLCIENKSQVFAIPNSTSVFSINSVSIPQIVIDNKKNCTERYAGEILGINTPKLLDYAHFLSAGIVCFARGLNDTPKIVALLISVKVFDLQEAMISVALCMALGGLINARKVAETMSKKITKLNHGQGFTANLVTGLLVIFASKLGLPVSTTHVSVGSLFGISLITKEANLKIISGIVLSWILTLPVAAILGSSIYYIFNSLQGF